MDDFNPRTPCGVRLEKVKEMAGDKMDFNPRTPCGVRLISGDHPLKAFIISIHAPHAGCDFIRC